MAGLDFSAIRVPHSGSSGSIGSGNGGNGGNGGGGGLAGLGGFGVQQNPISIGVNDDPAMVREAFFKNPDQLALVSRPLHNGKPCKTPFNSYALI